MVPRQVAEKVSKYLEHQRFSYICTINNQEVEKKFISREDAVGNADTDICPLICRQIERRQYQPHAPIKPELKGTLGLPSPTASF